MTHTFLMVSLPAEIKKEICYPVLSIRRDTFRPAVAQGVGWVLSLAAVIRLKLSDMGDEEAQYSHEAADTDIVLEPQEAVS